MICSCRFRCTCYLTIFLLLTVLGGTKSLSAYPVTITDSNGTCIVLEERPQKVVSLVPEVTEILFRLGVGDAVVGLTYLDTHPAEANQKAIIGGILTPSLAQIEALDPDVIFLSSLHQGVRNHFSDGECQIIEVEFRSIEDLFRVTRLLGSVFGREQSAEDIVRNMQDNLRLISRKTEKVPADKRKRVMRLMGRDRVMTPGEDSLQNQLIRAAGGITPQLGKKGDAVEVTVEEWKQFNPQVIYGCNGDRETANKFFSQPGWKDVEAVGKGRIVYFPCALTDHPSSHAGEFVAWLASTIYDAEFAAEGNRVLDESRVETRSLDVPLDYVRSVRVDETAIFDFPNKTLVIEFKEPMRVVSTLEGERKGILAVGNHYTPPPCWSLLHRLGFDACRSRIYKAIGKSKEKSCFLFTGADMGNLAVRMTQFKDMTVYALVTAGVEGNALRMSADEGCFYEPGTINMILLTNTKLSPRAMTRAIIAATEAKTAALQDLDVRSSATPLRNQATGTGTDEMLVVEGKGIPVDNTGGHCKMGELIAKAVYDGVKEAVSRQNGIVGRRSVYKRLQERHISLLDLLSKCPSIADQKNERQRLAQLEELLLMPRYASFLEAAFAFSDAYERGLVTDIEPFQGWCRNVSEEIAGVWIAKWPDPITSRELPLVVRMSLNALLNGLVVKE